MTTPHRPSPRDEYVALSRRRFLQAMGGMAGMAAFAPLLSACSGSSTASSGTASSGTSPGASVSSASTGGGAKGTVKVSNWPAYIDTDRKLLAQFQAASGMKVEYVEDYNDNNEYFAKVQPTLSSNQSIDRDIVTPTYWMAARWIALGWAEKLPLDKIPNSVNLRDDLVKPAWDPTGEYTFPWLNFITAIGYNRKLTGRDLTSVNDLFDPAFRGKVTFLTELRDTLGLMLLADGKNPAKFQLADTDAAFAKLDKAKRDGQIRAFTGNEYLQDLSAGNIAACVAYSGDVVQLSKENPDIKFIVPDEGAMLNTDVMLVPRSAANVDGAAAWMNFFYDPKISAQLVQAVNYISPVKGTIEELTALGGSAAALVNSIAVNPTPAQLAKLVVFKSLNEADEATLDEKFSKIVGA